MPVKPLTFKGEKRPKKRKHRENGSITQYPGENVSKTEADEDDSWTSPDSYSDLAGPTIMVLPTVPVTCLAADAHGNIFASLVENMIEDRPDTSEPHDIRQVWVANQVAGTGQFSFKASHGGYLSCDPVGILGATREARGLEEGFTLEPVGSDSRCNLWMLRTAASKKEDGEKGYRYLSALIDAKDANKEEKQDRRVSITLRGDGESDSASSQIIIKMQARFKPRLQQEKETKAREKISRQELEHAVGRRLDEDEVRRLKRAKRNGTFHEEILDVRVKGKHDKFAS